MKHEIETIGVKELPYYQSRSDVEIIDVRDEAEYEEAHIEGARNLPYEYIERWMGSLEKDKQYILYCQRGSASMMAAKQLVNQGYMVGTLIGGMNAYKG